MDHMPNQQDTDQQPSPPQHKHRGTFRTCFKIASLAFKASRNPNFGKHKDPGTLKVYREARDLTRAWLEHVEKGCETRGGEEKGFLAKLPRDHTKGVGSVGKAALLDLLAKSFSKASKANSLREPHREFIAHLVEVEKEIAEMEDCLAAICICDSAGAQKRRRRRDRRERRDREEEERQMWEGWHGHKHESAAGSRPHRHQEPEVVQPRYAPHEHHSSERQHSRGHGSGGHSHSGSHTSGYGHRESSSRRQELPQMSGHGSQIHHSHSSSRRQSSRGLDQGVGSNARSTASEHRHRKSCGRSQDTPPPPPGWQAPDSFPPPPPGPSRLDSVAGDRGWQKDGSRRTASRRPSVIPEEEPYHPSASQARHAAGNIPYKYEPQEPVYPTPQPSHATQQQPYYPTPSRNVPQVEHVYNSQSSTQRPAPRQTSLPGDAGTHHHDYHATPQPSRADQYNTRLPSSRPDSTMSQEAPHTSHIPNEHRNRARDGPAVAEPPIQSRHTSPARPGTPRAQADFVPQPPPSAPTPSAKWANDFGGHSQRTQPHEPSPPTYSAREKSKSRTADLGDQSQRPQPREPSVKPENPSRTADSGKQPQPQPSANDSSHAGSRARDGSVFSEIHLDGFERPVRQRRKCHHNPPESLCDSVVSEADDETKG